LRDAEMPLRFSEVLPQADEIALHNTETRVYFVKSGFMSHLHGWNRSA
jgi:hypothetical protein